MIDRDQRSPGGGPDTALPRVVVAPDSFKGTFEAAEVADALARGLERAGLVADRCPVADGGEGTSAAILAARDGRIVDALAHDPLGRTITAWFTMLDDRTALVETAAASGLGHLTAAERDPWAASTLGTGELIVAALDAGAETVLVAVGGSATVDGGDGALRALAQRPGGIGAARISVLCDVETTWERCAEVYGPQKGAGVALVARLSARLEAQALGFPRDPRGRPRTGAAGGLSGALWAVHGAELVAGAAEVLDILEFDRRLVGAIAVVCGEGCLDAQSAEGKIVSEVARRARHRGVAVHAAVGRCTLGPRAVQRLGLDSVIEATTLAELDAAGERLGRRLVAGITTT